MKSIPVINPVLYGFFNENFRREVNEFCRKVSFKLRHLNPFIESWIFQKVFSYVNGKKKLLFPKLFFLALGIQSPIKQEQESRRRIFHNEFNGFIISRYFSIVSLFQ